MQVPVNKSTKIEQKSIDLDSNAPLTLKPQTGIQQDRVFLC